MVDVVDDDGAALRGDAAGEAASERDADALLDLLLDALGGAREEQVVVQQQDRYGVDLEDLGDPAQQLLQELLLGQVRERRVRDPLQRVEHLPVAPRGPARAGSVGRRGTAAMLGRRSRKVTKVA